MTVSFEELGRAAFLDALLCLGLWRLRLAGVIALGAEWR